MRLACRSWCGSMAGRTPAALRTSPISGAARLAAKGVVVVTLNYRLGALGFFAHPSIADVSAGRQGISDQITALALGA